jgi:eukaryotic-like serine/threonine-protein kinase
MNENIRKLLPYGLVLLSFGLFCFIMVLIFDSILMPSIIKEEDTIKVPELIGKSLTDAEGIVAQNDLKVAKVTEQSSTEYPEGTVINQEPKPGKEVKAGRGIYLTVSKGASGSNVPNVTGISQREARMALMNAGFRVGNISYSPSDLYGSDTVISQSIRGNTGADPGSSIDLIISKGAEMQVQVPNLMHSDFADVAGMLEESGLILGKVEKKDGNGTFMANTVVSQKPEAGALVAKGTVVNIVITK